MSYVLTPLTKKEFSNYIDNKAIQILNYFIKHSLFAKPKILSDQNKIKLEIPKTYVE